MTKEELTRFLIPFVGEVEIVAEGVGGIYGVARVRYEMINGIGHVVLQLKD